MVSIKSVIFYYLIILFMEYDVLCAPQNSWPPKMKNFDIWSSSSDTSGRSVSDSNNGKLRNSQNNEIEISNQTSFRDSRVLNFFPLPVDDECLANDGMRSGICLNPYECRIQGGSSKGQCALGFGVCCVFTATCDQEVFNNITYVVSPSFPAMMKSSVKNCTLKIKMISPEVSQLRLDFIHFSMGQPNRSTGACDGDRFLLMGGAGGKNFTLCGQNHGQHIYYDVPTLPTPSSDTSLIREVNNNDGIIDLIMDFSDRFVASRLFEIKIMQIPFSQRAPAGCLQYFTDIDGIIQTFNFAENGRHLANQDYRACIREETGMCSIQYEPCFEQSFRIGPNRRQIPRPPIRPPIRPIVQGATNLAMNIFSPGNQPGGPGIPGGPAGPGIIQGDPIVGQAIDPATADALTPIQAAADESASPPSTLADDQQADASETVEGSGGGAEADAGGFFSFPSFPSFPSFGSFFGGGGGVTPEVVAPPLPASPLPSRRRAVAVGPLGRRFDNDDQDDLDEPDDQYDIYSHRESRQFLYPDCTDRITLPCVVEDFIAAGMGNLPSCLPIHCGDTLCDFGVLPCKIESTVKPFGIGFHFGDGLDLDKGSPEDNIGACLKYNQVSCG